MTAPQAAMTAAMAANATARTVKSREVQGVAEMSGSIGLIGALAGLRVLEDPTIPYDRMRIDHQLAAIVVGDINQFKYRMRQLTRNRECREAAAAHIKAEATRILGEPWELSP